MREYEEAEIAGIPLENLREVRLEQAGEVDARVAALERSARAHAKEAGIPEEQAVVEFFARETDTFWRGSELRFEVGPQLAEKGIFISLWHYCTLHPSIQQVRVIDGSCSRPLG